MIDVRMVTLLGFLLGLVAGGRTATFGWGMFVAGALLGGCI